MQIFVLSKHNYVFTLVSLKFSQIHSPHLLKMEEEGQDGRYEAKNREEKTWELREVSEDQREKSHPPHPHHKILDSSFFGSCPTSRCTSYRAFLVRLRDVPTCTSDHRSISRLNIETVQNHFLVTLNLVVLILDSVNLVLVTSP